MVALVLERAQLCLSLFLFLWPYRDTEGAHLLPDQRSLQWGPSPQEDMANFQVLVKLLPVMVTLVPYWMVYFQVGASAFWSGAWHPSTSWAQRLL